MFIYNGASGRAGLSMTARERQELAAKNPLHTLYCYATFLLGQLLVIINFARLILMALPVLRSETSTKETLKEWAENTIPRGLVARWLGFDLAWTRFVIEILAPIFSAVCTAPGEDVWQHPVEEFLGLVPLFPHSCLLTNQVTLDYIWLTFGTHHYVVTGGVRKVAERLAQNVEYVHVGTPVTAIVPDPVEADLVSIVAEGRTWGGFAHVIFATQANHALPLLRGYAKALPSTNTVRKSVDNQIDCLSAFQYARTIVVNHTDASLLPGALSDYRDLNLVSWHPSCPPVLDKEYSGICLPRSYAMATHIVPRPLGYRLQTRRGHLPLKPFSAFLEWSARFSHLPARLRGWLYVKRCPAPGAGGSVAPLQKRAWVLLKELVCSRDWAGQVYGYVVRTHTWAFRFLKGA
jgi:hypothetical protein